MKTLTRKRADNVPNVVEPYLQRSRAFVACHAELFGDPQNPKRVTGYRHFGEVYGYEVNRITGQCRRIWVKGHQVLRRQSKANR